MDQQPQQPTSQEFQSLQPAELVPPQGEPLQAHPADKKVWIYILIGLIVAGGAFGFYIWQKGGLFSALPLPTVSPTPTETPDLTAAWQTYRNEQYGFEFKYPGDLRGGGDDREFSAGYASSINLNVKIVDNKDFTILHPDWKSLVFQTYKLAGVDVKKYSNADKVFTYIPLPDLPDKQIEFFAELPHAPIDQILSTFRFIPSTSSGQIKPEICIQVITPARNPQTGEIRDFPTPCDVPEGWVKI